MALTASGAIANAQRLAASEQRRRWLAAAELSNRLLVAKADGSPACAFFATTNPCDRLFPFRKRRELAGGDHKPGGYTE
jgi:hypothetical protein